MMQNADGVILQYISKIQYIAKWRKIIVIVPLSPPRLEDKTRLNDDKSCKITDLAGFSFFAIGCSEGK